MRIHTQRPHRTGVGRLRTAIAAAAGALLLAGCGASGGVAGADSPASGSGAPANGGDVVFMIDSLGNTWVPNSSSISSFQGQVWGQLTDKLVYVDDEGEVTPWIAKSWDQNDEATEFTLHLVDGVTFSDGTPLDADAVVANLDYWAFGQADKGISPIGLFPKTYKSAKAIDDLTVKVTFKAATLGFIPTLGYHGSILLSPKTLAGSAEEQGDLAKSVGSGPFTVESWKDGDNVVLVKRDDYNWGPAALDHTGPAYLDSVTYKVNAESSVRTAAVQSGQATVGYNPSVQEIASLQGQGFTVDTPRYLGFVNGYALNTKVAPFNDPAVRKAFQHGINRQEILDTVYTPDWQPAETFFQSNLPGAIDASDTFAYDADEANKLLDDAGWTTGSDGIRSKDGKALEFTLYPNPYLGTSQSVSELVAQQLSDIGFKVNIKVYDVVTFSERITINSDAVSAYEITRSIVDAGTVAGVLTSENNGENWFNLGTSDSTLVDYATSVAGATDTTERDADLADLQTYVLDQAYFIPLTQIVQRIYLIDPALQGVTYNGVVIANFYTAYLNS